MTRSFADFVGNDAAVTQMRNAYARGQGTHAYLITGPAQIGKRTLAIAFAAQVVCNGPRPEAPCGACPSCHASGRNGHPDIHLVERRDEKRTILTEQAQEVIHQSSLHPYLSTRKVFIVREASILENEAANRLLKTIEEPPPDTVIILTTNDADQVLPTIRSRCREVGLRTVPLATVAKGLIDRGVDGDQADLLARLSGGRPGWAISTSDDPAQLTRRDDHLTLLETVLETRRARRLALADRLEDSRQVARTRERMAAAFEDWVTWWRDALVCHAGCPELITNIDREGALRQASGRLDAPQIIAALTRTREAWAHIDANVNPRLAIEGLFLDLPDLT
jgi:DNA polymerase-3 subunit delta'